MRIQILRPDRGSAQPTWPIGQGAGPASRQRAAEPGGSVPIASRRLPRLAVAHFCCKCTHQAWPPRGATRLYPVEWTDWAYAPDPRPSMGRCRRHQAVPCLLAPASYLQPVPTARSLLTTRSAPLASPCRLLFGHLCVPARTKRRNLACLHAPTTRTRLYMCIKRAGPGHAAPGGLGPAPSRARCHQRPSG